METWMYVAVFLSVLFLFIARRYVVLNWLDRKSEAYRETMAIKRTLGKVVISLMVILAGLLYIKGEMAWALDLSVITAFVLVLAAGFGGG